MLIVLSSSKTAPTLEQIPSRWNRAILAAAAYFLKGKPASTPGATPTTQRTSQ
jgi:hypothetical protein